MTSLAISVTGLHKTYGNVVALDGVSFEVANGSVLGLLGPNGSGKTTAVSILSTALRPDAGHARVCGFDVGTQGGEVRRVIGFAGQFAAVDANLTGRENLALIGRLSRLPRSCARDRASELLAGFGLAAAADRLVRTYPGGMRRRLDVAAALVQRIGAAVFRLGFADGADRDLLQWSHRLDITAFRTATGWNLRFGPSALAFVPSNRPLARLEMR